MKKVKFKNVLVDFGMSTDNVQGLLWELHKIRKIDDAVFSALYHKYGDKFLEIENLIISTIADFANDYENKVNEHDDHIDYVEGCQECFYLQQAQAEREYNELVSDYNRSR
jgi:hypothetical protein